MRVFHLVHQWLFPGGRSDHGSVHVEYIAVFAFVSIGIAVSFVKLGPTLFQAWGTTQHVLLANKP